MMSFSILLINFFNYLIPYIKFKILLNKSDICLHKLGKITLYPLSYTLFYTPHLNYENAHFIPLNYFPGNTCPPKLCAFS